MAIISQEHAVPNSLMEMVTNHYDNKALTQLEGEITFDCDLSSAEVNAALLAYTQTTGKALPERVYLPMAGPLRHVEPLLHAGIQNIVAVDLSQGSFNVGLERFGNITLADGSRLRDRVAIHCTDVRNISTFTPNEGFDLALSMGNSFGDVTDPEGHRGVMQAIADTLAPGGAFVFDYVGTRYNPPIGEVCFSTWDDTHVADNGTETAVIDTRTRWFEPVDTVGNGILRFTCHVRAAEDGHDIVPHHPYEKLTLTDGELEKQFKSVGLRLVRLGSMNDLSQYHKGRNDLGMMGEPNHLYVAIKDSTLLSERGERYASITD